MSFQFADFVFLFFSFGLLGFLGVFFVFSEVNFLEEVEERFNLFLNGFLFVFIFLLDDLDGNVFTLLPVDIVSEASLDFGTCDFEFFGQGGVGEPFVFREGEYEFEAGFAFPDGIDSGEVLDQGLVDLSDFLADDIVGDQGFEPVLVEGDLLVIIMLEAVLFFVQDCVVFEVSV